MNSNIKSFKVKNCRICNSTKLYNYINLGNQPPSNSFVKKKNISTQKKFPLKVILCKECGLSQLDTVVLSSGIFDKYSYLSSTSKALIKNYEIMVKNIIQKFKPKKK